MKLLLNTLALIIFIGFNVNSQTQDTDPKDPRAREILKKLSDKTKSLSAFRAEFTYTLKNAAANLNETEKGNILISGEKYNLEISGQQIVSNGQKLWTFIKDAGEVTIDLVDPEAESDLDPAKLFTVYDEGFKYQFDGESNVSGKTIETVKLFPIEAGEKPFHTIILKVNKSLNEIHSIQIKMKDGNDFTYVIDKFVSNPSITQDSFNFDVSQAEDVIDLTE
jgi:outer membrane lipoprotein-sorting protein